MTESCANCGAELYGGQQFCRRCGTPVGAALTGGEAPTQLLNEGAQAGAAAQLGGTSPLGEGAHTEGVAGQRPTEYQP
ncbi:MAG: zinc-ribbon domain-containing protein, partial [Pyrinomonadaceae bacterium]